MAYSLQQGFNSDREYWRHISLIGLPLLLAVLVGLYGNGPRPASRAGGVPVFISSPPEGGAKSQTSSSSSKPGSTDTSAPLSSQTSSGAGVSSAGSTGTSSTPIGGYGGGPAPTNTGGSSTTTSGVLPLTLTLPGQNLQLDQKQVLDTSSTTVTVN